MNGARCFWSAVAPNSARERKLREELFQTLPVLGLVRINLGISALQVGVGEDGRSTMTWPSQEKYVEIVLFNQPVQMDIDQAHAGVRAPVTEQSKLCVFGLQWLFEERIIPQIDHAKTEVETRSPVSIHLSQLLTREGRTLN